MERLALALLITLAPLSARAGAYLPVAPPQISTVNPVVPAQNDNKPDTTANSQNRLSHVANMAAVAGWANTGQPVEVDGFAAAGDGGRHRVVFDSANKCGAGGHPAADGVTCVNSTVVTAGSWNIDWGSVNNTAGICMFENCGSVTDDTAGLKAAVATLKPVDISMRGGSMVLSSDVPLHSGQKIFGAGLGKSFITVNSNSGFSKGVFVADAAEPGPELRDFVVQFSQPSSPSSSTPLVAYVPMLFAQNTPRFKIDRIGCYFAWVCVDMRGNSGGSELNKFQFSGFAAGVLIDGALDTVRFVDPHYFPWGMTSGMQSYFTGNGAASSSAKSGMVGNGTLTLAPSPANYPGIVGTYKVIFSTSNSLWRVYDPNGAEVYSNGGVPNGSAFCNQICFTVAAGSTAFGNNDEFDVAVTQVRPVGLYVGRMDDLSIKGGLFLGGLGIQTYYGTGATYSGVAAGSGPAFGTIEGTDFDTKSGAVLGPASGINFANTVFTLDNNVSQALVLWGGPSSALPTTTAVSGGTIGTAGTPVTAMVVADQAPYGQPNRGTSGSLGLSNVSFGSAATDATLIYQGQFSFMQLMGNRFQKVPGSYSKPIIDLEGGRSQVGGNWMNDQSGNVFLKVANDNPFNKVFMNSAPGSTYSFPSSPQGSYNVGNN